MKNSPFLQQLRQSTAHKHQQLENIPLSRQLMSPDITIEQYAQYLENMLPVMKDADENIFPKLKELLPDIDQRRKTSHIIHDLHHLNYKPNFSNKPISENLTQLSLPFALGIAYVIEGSTLGGRVILKHLSNTPLQIENANTFFHGYGEQTGHMWTKFLDTLIKFGQKTGSSEEIIEGANHCFDSIYQHFQATVA